MNIVKSARAWIGTPFSRSLNLINEITRGNLKPVDGPMEVGDILEIKEPRKDAWFAVYSKNEPMRQKRIIRNKPGYGVIEDYLHDWYEMNIVGVFRLPEEIK